MFAYESSKAAGIHLVRSLASTLAAYDINVNALIPGTVLTEKLKAYIQQTGSKLLDSTPTRRWTGAEELVGLMLYCCSRAGINTTGAVLTADGGQQVMPLMRS
jgi:gluconate 5-dehydrogenase